MVQEELHGLLFRSQVPLPFLVSPPQPPQSRLWVGGQVPRGGVALHAQPVNHVRHDVSVTPPVDQNVIVPTCVMLNRHSSMFGSVHLSVVVCVTFLSFEIKYV